MDKPGEALSSANGLLWRVSASPMRERVNRKSDVIGRLLAAFQQLALRDQPRGSGLSVFTSR